MTVEHKKHDHVSRVDNSCVTCGGSYPLEQCISSSSIVVEDICAFNYTSRGASGCSWSYPNGTITPTNFFLPLLINTKAIKGKFVSLYSRGKTVQQLHPLGKIGKITKIRGLFKGSSGLLPAVV